MKNNSLLFVEDLLTNNKEFLKLLDEEDSEKMANYLKNINQDCYQKLQKLFDDLNIFQDIALYTSNLTKKYKYIFGFTKDAWNINKYEIDLRGAHVYKNAIRSLDDTNLIMDNTTILDSYAIWISAVYTEQRYKLTFLGIPKIEDGGICIYPMTVNQVEIYAKKGLTKDIQDLFNNKFISTNKPTLKNRIKEY